LSSILQNNQKPQSNIPKSIRDTINAKFERKEKLRKAAGSVQDIYLGAIKDTVKTRKGFWTKYTQADYVKQSFSEQEKATPVSRFCAVYYRENIPRTIIRGNTADVSIIGDFLNRVTGKIIEQRPFISFPKKSLTEEKGLSYGIRVGFIFAVFLTIFIIFDYTLIPDHPEEILQGANIITEKNVNDYSPNAGIFQYRSITERLIEFAVPKEYRHLLSSMYSLFIIFILPILIISIFFEFSGKKADRRRMKGFPEESLEYQYGFDAINAVLDEDNLRRREKLKRDLYSRLAPYGMQIDKADFEKILSDYLELL